MTIKEVELVLEVPRATIRFYEKEGFLNPTRGGNGYREYSSEELVTLKQIIVLRKLGISLSDIHDVLDGAGGLQRKPEHQYTEGVGVCSDTFFDIWCCLVCFRKKLDCFRIYGRGQNFCFFNCDRVRCEAANISIKQKISENQEEHGWNLFGDFGCINVALYCYSFMFVVSRNVA